MVSTFQRSLNLVNTENCDNRLFIPVLSKRVLSKEEITHVKINHETIKELIDTRSSITAAKVFESRIDRFLEVVPDSTEVVSADLFFGEKLAILALSILAHMF